MSDREYLLGEKQLEGQDERNARYRIRSRLIQSLLDLALLGEELHPRDMDQVVADERLSNEWIPIMLIAQANAFLLYNDDIVDPASKLENWVESAVTVRPPTRGPERGDGMVELVDISASASIEIQEDPVNVREMMPDEIVSNMSDEEIEEWVQDALRAKWEEEGPE